MTTTTDTPIICESCGVQDARTGYMRAVTTNRFNKDRTLRLIETWVLCRKCFTRLEEIIENTIVYGELRNPPHGGYG